MTTDNNAYQYLRLPRDPLGATLGWFFWLLLAFICWWLIALIEFSSPQSWLDYHNEALNPKTLLSSAALFQQASNTSSSFLPGIAFLQWGIWLCGKALPWLLFLLSAVAIQRASHFFRHKHLRSATPWFIKTSLAFLLALVSYSGFAKWNHLPLESMIGNFPNIHGGFLGNEVASILRYYVGDVTTTLILVSGMLVSTLWLFGLGLFRTCELIGVVLDFIHVWHFQKKGEKVDRSLGQAMAQLREQTVVLDKNTAADKSVRIVRQPAPTTQKITPPPQPQTLFRSPAPSPTAIPKTNSQPNSLTNASPRLEERKKETMSRSTSHSTAQRSAFKIISKPGLHNKGNSTSPMPPSMHQPQRPFDTIKKNHTEKPAEVQNLMTPPKASEDLKSTTSSLKRTQIFAETHLSDAQEFEKTTVLSPPDAISPPDSDPTIMSVADEALQKDFEDFSLDFSKTAIPEPTVQKIIEAPTPPPAPPSAPPPSLPDDSMSKSISESQSEDIDEEEEDDQGYSHWEGFPLPSINLLDTTPSEGEPPNDEVIRLISGQIESSLKSFGVSVAVKAAYPGPVITRYEIELASGVKGAQIVNLSKDLARTLAVMSIRVVENIPGKPWMGLEVPNERRQIVKLVEILSSAEFQNDPSPLTMAIGKDISGVPRTLNLAKMPHLLVAGTTGSGKSVGLNDMILSMLYKATPNEVRMVLIDPKMVELSVYKDIPHLIAPVITDMKQAVGALNWCVNEMERREQLLSKLSVRNISKFNQKVLEARSKGTPIPDPVEKERLENMGAEDFSRVPMLGPLPYLVVVVDEFADLFMVVGKKIEEVIARLAQKGRAGGVHLILATQRPSVDVVTGLIKANVPSRIAFQVSSKIDSRTILDQQGAEALLGQGDMLYYRPGQVLERFHGAFVSDDEVNAVTDYLREIAEPKYLVQSFDDPTEEGSGKVGTGLLQGKNEYDTAVQIITSSETHSISYLQRRMEIGFNKAAKFIEQMEKEGILSPPGKNGKRSLLVPKSTGDH